MPEQAEKQIKKVDAKPDAIDTSNHVIKYDEKDKLLHGMSNNADFKKKYGDKWRSVANALAHIHTHFLRTKRDR